MKQGSTVCECGRDDIHSSKDCWTFEDKMKKYAELNLWVHKLKNVIEEKEIMKWLCTPNKALDNKIPFEMIMEGNIVELNKKIYETGEEVFS
jgi:Protein of unknown function (DUF2384)